MSARVGLAPTLGGTLCRHARPLTGRADDYDGLLDVIGDTHFVLLGEASHGTHEFYTLVRSGEWQVISVTVFEGQDALDAATAAISPLVRARVRPLASEAPARYHGPVLHHLAA